MGHAVINKLKNTHKHTHAYTQMVISKSYFCFFWEDKWDKKGS